MKAIFLTALNTLELRDIPAPTPGPGEVLVHVGAVGICGSDVHYYRHGKIGIEKAVYPQALGHEPSGTIEAVGTGVDAARVDERVAIEPGIGCGECEFCRSARENLCPKVIFLGSPGRQGAYREFVVMPGKNCVPVPKTMTMAAAAMLEPFAVGVEAASIANIRPGFTACVLGCGSIGLSTMAAAAASGVTEIFGVDPLEFRRTAAQKHFGAGEVFGGPNDKVAAWLMDETNGRGVDVVFEASGDHAAFTIMPDLAVRGGMAVIIGIPTADSYSFSPHIARRKGLTITNCRRSNRKLETAIKLAETGRVDLDKLVTHRFSLEDTAKGFDLVDGYRDGVIKAIVAMEEQDSPRSRKVGKG
ncbi:MAG: alcohol dehydrogenase catalytic domain-containing protein [Planctomycetota bacterium]